jgi:hypothetical protein
MTIRLCRGVNGLSAELIEFLGVKSYIDVKWGTASRPDYYHRYFYKQ